MKKFSKTLRDNWIFLLMVFTRGTLVILSFTFQYLGMWSPLKTTI